MTKYEYKKAGIGRQKVIFKNGEFYKDEEIIKDLISMDRKIKKLRAELKRIKQKGGAE